MAKTAHSIATVPLDRVLVYVLPAERRFVGVAHEREHWFTVDPGTVYGARWALQKWTSYLRKLGATHWQPALPPPKAPL